METLLQVAVSNAAAAVVLSLAAAGAARLLRRPPLTRALWLLVLLKLITPPFWTIHIILPHAPTTRASGAFTIPAKTSVAAAPAPDVPSAGLGERVIDHVPPDVMQEVDRTQTMPAAPRVTGDAVLPPGLWSWIGHHWTLLIAIVWLSGSATYLVLVLHSELRLRLLVRQSQPAFRNVTLRCAELSRRLGLRRPPEVRFLNRHLAPMLCAIAWRPRLLVPAALWDKLTEGQRDSVLAHELAHLRRGDHWVRLFELLISGLYWWLPVVWWARSELREATEQCCDAWVLWTIPRSQRNYATALVEAIDYLSTAQARVPLSATGMGQFTNLKRRLVMINRGTARRTLGWPAMAGVCAAAALLLPLSPTVAQVASATPAAANHDEPSASVTTGATTAAPDGETVAVTSAPDKEVAANQNPDRSQIEAARADVEGLRAKLEAAEARLALLEHGNQRGGGQFGNAFGRPEHNGSNYVNTMPQNPAYGAGRGSRFGGGGGFGGSAMGGAGYPAAAGLAANATPATAEQRLDALEEQLLQLQRALHELREQMHPHRPSGLQAK